MSTLKLKVANVYKDKEGIIEMPCSEQDIARFIVRDLEGSLFCGGEINWDNENYSYRVMDVIEDGTDDIAYKLHCHSSVDSESLFKYNMLAAMTQWGWRCNRADKVKFYLDNFLGLWHIDEVIGLLDGDCDLDSVIFDVPDMGESNSRADLGRHMFEEIELPEFGHVPYNDCIDYEEYFDNHVEQSVYICDGLWAWCDGDRGLRTFNDYEDLRHEYTVLNADDFDEILELIEEIGDPRRCDELVTLDADDLSAIIEKMED